MYLAEALERFVKYEHRQGSIVCARLAGLLAIEAGRLREGVPLVAAAQALAPAAALEIDDAVRFEQAVASAQARLEPAEYAVAWGEGAALNLAKPRRWREQRVSLLPYIMDDPQGFTVCSGEEL